MEINYRTYIKSELIRHPFRNDEEVIQIVTEGMQLRYPGEYTMELQYSPRHFRFIPVVIFEDKNKELMWMLKYS